MKAETYNGNIEYKRYLTDCDDEKFQHRATQMKFRLTEGSGEAIYYIGVDDCGTVVGTNVTRLEESLTNMYLIADSIGADAQVLDRTTIRNSKETHWVAHVLIREKAIPYVDLRIGIVGNVDAGKSTTLGTLLGGTLDNGRGSARKKVFVHRHEIESGRTSSIGHKILGFDAEGNVVNHHQRKDDWRDIVKKSIKVINFYDLAGHEKYLKTTIHGLSSKVPDYCLVMVATNMGTNHITHEHLSICESLHFPVIIILTKSDLAPPAIRQETIRSVKKLCRNLLKRPVYRVSSTTDVMQCLDRIKVVVPMIEISNVTGHNLKLLYMLLRLLPKRNRFSRNCNKKVQYFIDQKFSVSGHHAIVSGLLQSGTVQVNDTLWLGPQDDSTYREVKIRSIHRKYCPIEIAYSGSFVCLSLKGITNQDIRKGMVLVQKQHRLAVRDFTAKIRVLHTPTTIRVGYQPFLNINHISQVAEITAINTPDGSTILRNGDIALVRMRFIFHPEYIQPKMKIFFRESKVKAEGRVTKDII